MATAEEIRAQIAAATDRFNQERQTAQALASEKTQALERQNLRNELRRVNRLTENQWITNQAARNEISDIDKDAPTPAALLKHASVEDQKVSPVSVIAEENVACNAGILKGEFVWQIAGMSWLEHALKHCESDEYAVSEGCLSVGLDDCFDFVYHPRRGGIRANGDTRADTTHCASLAIRCLEPTSSTFKYKIFVQRNDGEFVQWGCQGDFCDHEVDKTMVILGPDVQSKPGPARGIFGLSHEELLQSEWVHQDTLIAKFEFELLPAHGCEYLPPQPITIDIPPPSLSSNMLSLFDEGKLCDVTFMVRSETIKAHACVLAARSEVFDRELHCGMRESRSKEVFIDDCEAHIFRAVLQFLYSDDFSHIQKSMKTCEANSSKAGTGDAADSPSSKVRFLQDVFSVSHKYQISRLSTWCQRQLCDLVSHTEVCSLLQQAHLLDAKVLQEVCLKYIKSNMEKVVGTSEFAKVTSEWPELLLKIGLSGSGVSATTAASAVALQQSFLRKRKRE